MHDDQSQNPVPAQQIAHLHRLTDLSLRKCKQLLAPLSPAQRESYIAAIKAHPDPILHDPIEDDPTIRPLFLTVCAEADLEIREWHRQRIAELTQKSPAVADLFRSQRGLCHRRWSRIKELLRDRHGIDWRSPPEMNPGTMFD